MRKPKCFLSIIIILSVAFSCSVNNLLPLKKVDPPIYKYKILCLDDLLMGKPFNIQDSLRYIRSEVQRNIMLGLILRYPINDVFYSKNYIDPFKTSKRPFSRFQDYKLKKLQRVKYEKFLKLRDKDYDKEKIIADMLRFIIPPNFDLLMLIRQVDFFDTIKVYGITCKDSLIHSSTYLEGPFIFYTISTNFEFKYNKYEDSLAPSIYTEGPFYSPFRGLVGSSNSTIKRQRYLIAFNQNYITHPFSVRYGRNGCSKDILYLSKEFLQYDESVNFLRSKMKNSFNPEMPETYIPYIKILAYSDYDGRDFSFVKKNKKELRFIFYSQELERKMEAIVSIDEPVSVKFKLVKEKKIKF